MANNTEEGKVTVTYVGNVPTYTVKIKDFKKKMKTWPIGKLIRSELFTVNSVPLTPVPLTLEIYPNGDTAKEGHVSVFLKNNSVVNSTYGGNIQVDYTFKMKGKIVNHSKVDFQPSQVVGVSALYCHKGVANIGGDDETKIGCTIRSLKKNVSDIQCH